MTLGATTMGASALYRLDGMKLIEARDLQDGIVVSFRTWLASSDRTWLANHGSGAALGCGTRIVSHVR